MPMSPADIDELKALLKKARQRVIAFGLCLGKKPEDNVMCMDLKKSGEVMMRKAKAEGETSKLTFGTVEVTGKIINVTLEGKMLPNLAKNMKIFLMKNNIKMKVVILDAEGQTLDDDGDEEEDTDDARVAADDSGSDETATDATEDADPMAAQWEKVAGALTPMVSKFAASGHAKAPAIGKAWAGAETAAANGDYKTAMAVAGKVKPVLSEAPADTETTAQNPDTAKWEKLVGPLSGLFEKAMKTNPDNRTQLNAAWMMAVDKADAGDPTAALAIAGKLKPRLDEALAAGASAPSDIPKDVVAFQKSRILWIDTRKTMFQEMSKLEKAISDVCAGDPDLAEVANDVKSLSARLGDFDDRLQDILDQITNTPEGSDRTALKQQARTAISEYQNVLSSDFFKDVDANNGFVNVNISAAAQTSLGKIDKVLAAA